jgi:hypothetical protein
MIVFSGNIALKLHPYRWMKRLLFMTSCLVGTILSFGQNETIPSNKDTDTLERPAYLTISLGSNISTFRDFATSPLIYSGNPFYVSLSHIDMDEKRVSSIKGAYAFGKYTNTFNHQTSVSSLHTISFNHLELFQVKRIRNEKLNVKWGGQFNSLLNLRRNEALFNNKEGVDVIATLFGSVQTTIDISRTKEMEKKFLFLKYQAPKRTRNISYTLNIGLVNSSFRNGFAYTSSSAPINSDEFFADYDLSVFSGLRLQSALDYTMFLKNKNGLQFSYLWDALRTGGHHNNFEMAQHTLSCSLLFNLK